MTTTTTTPMVCWHEVRNDWRHRDVCPAGGGDLILWGRCRSGRRWFWAALAVGDIDRSVHGWADSEDQAVTDARTAVVELAGSRSAVAVISHGQARHELKAVNAEKRRNRPPSGATDAGPVEYLYGIQPRGDDAADQERVVRFQITRKTARRIYYVRWRGRGDDVRIGFVSRQEIETNGEAYNRSGGWWAGDYHLYAAPPELPRYAPLTAAERKAELARLRREMGDAHPDRGGTAEGFMAARARYKAAVARAGTRGMSEGERS